VIGEGEYRREREGKRTELGGDERREAKTDEPIEMSFGIRTHAGSVNHVLDWDEHWCQLANTVVIMTGARGAVGTEARERRSAGASTGCAARAL